MALSHTLSVTPITLARPLAPTIPPPPLSPPLASTETRRLITKQKRKAAMASDNKKPNRPPPAQNLRFVVANDPDQFRDRSIMRNNRSHVMHNHLSEKRQSTAARTASEEIRVRKKSRSGTPARIGSPSQPRLERSATDQIMGSAEALAIYRRTADPKQRRRNTLAGDTPNDRALEMGDFGSPLDDPEQFAPYAVSPLAEPAAGPERSSLFYPSDIALVNYIRSLRGSTPVWHSLSSLDDPYHDLQRAEDTLITVEVFKDHCINGIREHGAAFRSEADSFEDKMYWFGTMSLASPDISLDPENFASIAASDGANAEAMEVLGRSFSDPQARVSDMTVLSVLFLIERATITGDSTLAVVHEEGLKSVLNLRGSLDEMCSGMKIPLLVIVALSAIARERRLDPFFSDYFESRYSNIPVAQRSPQSPLFFPSSGFGFIFDSDQCKQRTQDILQSACKLTSLAAEASHLRNCDIVDPTFQMHVENVQRQRDIDGQISEVRYQIFSVGHGSHDGDWVFESCRIAASLWATAITHKVSLMEAAACMERRSLLQNATTKLLHAIQQTDLSTCWDNMAGVLLWTCMIGGAAAKDQQERSRLLAIAMRCIIVTLTEYKYAVLDSVMKLLKVMQLWTDGRIGN